MKIFLLFAIAVLFALASCKKSGDSFCTISVPGIAGSFKITKLELIDSSGLSTDVSQGLSACELSAVFNLNADSTASYTQTGTNCSGNFDGTWDITDNKLTLTKSFGSLVYTNAPVTGWDCRSLIISQPGSLAGSPVIVQTTFTRQ